MFDRMGFSCFKCHQHVNGNANNLFYHLRTFHNLIDGGLFNCAVPCSQEGCLRTFIHTWSLKRHMNSQHRGLIEIDDNNEADMRLNHVVDPDLGDDDDVAAARDMNEDEVEQAAGIDYLENFDSEELENRALSMICAMKASTSVVQSTVDLVVNQTSDMFSDVIEYVKYRTKNIAMELGIDQDNDLLQNLIDDVGSLQYPFKKLDSSFKQKKAVQKSGSFVQPLEIPITMGYAPRLNPVTGEVRQVMIHKTFQYVPIKEVLKLVLESPGFMECVQELRKSEDGLLRDFIDGHHYNSCRLLKKETTINILLFADDVEVTNPLSPKAGSHKIGMLYFAIKSLPTKFLSSLNNCFLLAIYKSCDAKDFGLHDILMPFIRDMRSLQEDGLYITSEAFTGIVRCGIAQVVGDNLGIHGMFGFSEGFTANYFCRICKGHREVLRRQVVADSEMLRNRQNYEQDLLQANLPETGIKAPTPLNDVMDFHVTKNYAHDIMHDLLEGICPLELKLIVKALVDDGKFTLATLNGRITSFDYGFPDSSNKPCGIPQSALQNPDGSAGQNAAQMWCLIRNFPLMIGDCVEEGNKYWELLLLLLDCMDLIFAPVISNEDTLFLKRLIQDHHALFLELYPERNLRPKHHFMLHYPRAIREVGPMNQFWAMRFEAKHNFFKRIAHITCNFKNIAKTLAHRHQMNLCFQMMSGKSLKDKELEIGPGSAVLLASLDHSEIISTALGGVPLFDDIFVANWCRFYGKKYRAGMMVVIDKDNDLDLIFGKIIHILADEYNVKLIVEKWHTVEYRDHVHAYTVQPLPNSIAAVALCNLIDFRPLHATKSYLQEGKWNICTRYKI